MALARRGLAVAFTFRNKAARADDVSQDVRAGGVDALPIQCDITQAEDLASMVTAIREWGHRLRLLVLNASGGLERDLVAADPDYPLRMNRDAQLAVVDAVLPLLESPATIVFVTSHWAHRYGDVPQLPHYEPVARSKHAGEAALRERSHGLGARGVRLLVVTGDLVEGTITARLLERADAGVRQMRERADAALPTVADMADAIVGAALDARLPTGHTVVVGRSLADL